MSEPKPEKVLVLHDTVFQAIAKSIVGAVMVIAIIGAGRWMESAAMQWCGFAVLCAIAFAKGSTKRVSPQEAADRLYRDWGVVAFVPRPTP